MDPVRTAAAAAGPVWRLGGAFMLDPATRAAGAARGLSAWGCYYGGRFGVLGAAPASVVAAAGVFLPPERVASGWGKATAALPPHDLVDLYAGACRTWARRHLAGLAAAGELATLLDRVVGAAEPAGLPLFAGWRDVPLPADPSGRCGQLLHVLREHRGGLHGLAVLATGLTPLQAILASDGGPALAAWFGWPEPYPDPAPYLAARAAAEQLTDRLAAPTYGELDVPERVRLVELLGAAEATARKAGVADAADVSPSRG